MAIGNFTMATRARYVKGFLKSLDDENGVDETTTVKTTWCGVLWTAKYITKKNTNDGVAYSVHDVGDCQC
jgi:hypothetical protein